MKAGIKILIFITLLIVSPLFYYIKVNAEKSSLFNNFFTKDIQTYLENMSLEQKIGQILIFGFHGASLDDDYREWLTTGKLGNIKIFLRNVQSKQQLIELTNSITAYTYAPQNGIPPFIATDLEGGVVNHIRFPGIARPPGAGLIGATTYAENNRNVARLIAFTLFELGINMNFAPCADVLTSPHNNAIGTRSYSSDPNLVSAMVKAFVEEQKKMGILATAKHFPGHGMTNFDSHHRLIAVNTTKREFEQIHLLPYSCLLGAGLLDGCMIAHIIYTEFDSEYPASFSSTIVNNLLREDMKFNGIVVTDDLEMKGSQKYAKDILQAFTLAFKAGNDIMLVSHSKSKQVKIIDNIADYFRKGILSEEELNEKVLRILRIKKKYLLKFYSMKTLNGDFGPLQVRAIEESRKATHEGIVLLSSHIKGSLPAYFKSIRDNKLKGIILAPTEEFAYLAQSYLSGWDIVHIEYLPDRRSNNQKIDEVRPYLGYYDFAVLGLANLRQIEWAKMCVEEHTPFCILSINNPFSAYQFIKDAIFIAACFDPYRPGLDALFQSVFETGKFSGTFPYYF